jgi:cytochrome c-type protein NapB
MKLKIALFAGLAALVFGLPNAGPLEIIDDSMGLSPVSVLDVPVPTVFEHRTLDPKESGVLPRYWEDAPPQVPHRIDKYLPVNAKANKCLECHEEPGKIGKKVKGKPTPMSETHYLKDAAGELTVSNKRYICTLCHAPQADVGTLVDNTYRGDQ